MAQFNQLQTSASQVVNPPDNFISFFYDESKKWSFLDSSGPFLMSASILAVSASVSDKALKIEAGDQSITGSLGVTGSIDVTGSIGVTNNISASSIRVVNLTADTASIIYLTSIFETSSVSFSSGSTKFGDEAVDIHQFTGSVGITGSLTLGNSLIRLNQSASVSGTNVFGTASWSVKSDTYRNNYATAVTWSVVHNLDTLTPLVQVWTGSYVMLPADIQAIDSSSVEITFAEPTTGVAVVKY